MESLPADDPAEDSDVSLEDLGEVIPDFNDWGRDPEGVAKAAALSWSLSCQSLGKLNERKSLRLH